MDSPPSYKEVAPEYGKLPYAKHEKATQRFSIREEVGASRSQHVAALVQKVLPQIRDRAQSGLSKSTYLLVPSGQDAAQRGMLVGFPDDETPILVQLEGKYDSLEFWAQQEALRLLRDHLLNCISEGLATSYPTADPVLPLREPSPRKSSFFGRKQSKQEPPKAQEQARLPVSVEVMLDEVSFRGENDFGLYETLQGKAVVVRVEVR